MVDPEFLRIFSNLRELRIFDKSEKIDFELFLPEMKSLTTLIIGFDESCDPNLISKIYKNCT